MNEQTIADIANLIAQIGPQAIELVIKLEALLNLGPDEKQNIANAVAASNAADQDTIARAKAWAAAHPATP